MKDPLEDAGELAWLVRLARALLGQGADADDLVQDTLVATLERPIPPGAPRRAWLATVARRLAARRRRGDGRRERREARVARPEALPDTTRLVERAESAARLSAAVGELAEPYRTTLLLRFLDGRDTDWIAAREGVRPDTVRKRLRHALAELRERLDREERRRGSDWSVLLLPLVDGSASPGAGAAARAGTRSTSILASTSMKLTLATAVALFGAGLFSLLDPSEPESPAPAAAPTVRLETPAARAPTSAAEPDASTSLVAGPAAPMRSAAGVAGDAGAVALDPGAVLAPDLFGRVVDERGRPLEGALVYLVRPAEGAPRGSVDDGRDGDGGERAPAVGAAPDPASVAARPGSPKPGTMQTATAPGRSPMAPVRTGPDGEFRFGAAVLAPVDGAGPLELGVHRNGYVRTVVVDPLADPPEGGLEIVLVRGPLLAGRIVDAEGRPVSDLPVIATVGDDGPRQVSPTVARARADAWLAADSTSAYHECRATTGAGGQFVISGLPAGALRLTSLDPGWSIDDADPVPVDAGFATWTARRALGARVELVAPGLAVRSVSATFRVALEFADGASEEFGPWAGHGPGLVELRLDERALPALARSARVPVAATFRGTLSLGALTTEWEAPPIVDPERATGVATVRVPFERLAAELPAFTAERAAVGPTPPATDAEAILRIRARYTDGAPLDRTLAVTWTSTDAEGATRSGVGMLRPDAEGRLELEVEPGSVRLDLRPKGASGSLPPWVDTLECAPGATLEVDVTLRRGGTVQITRPDGWGRLWYVQASYRASPDEAWTGSWDYLALDEVHTLTALLPAEWRLRLRRTKGGASEYEHLVRVAEGETVAVP